MDETESYRRIIATLKGHGVEFETYTHEHIHSSHDAARVRGTVLEEAAKALVLQAGNGLVQCIVNGHRRLDLKVIKQLLGERNIALAHPDKVLAASGCTVGSVPPFGNLFEPPMPVYCDKDLFSREHIVFSAGSHHHSIRMRAEDWKTVVKPIVVEIGRPA
jgi:Ala-tRNA(Pro) deacylase